jgi:VanZ family protein
MTGQKIFQIAAWFCFAAIVVLSLVSPALRPVTVVPHALEHAAIFALTGFAVGFGYPNRFASHTIALAIFAAAIELAQFYAPGRHPRLIDFVIDALAACAGLALAFLILRFCVRPAARSS